MNESKIMLDNYEYNDMDIVYVYMNVGYMYIDNGISWEDTNQIIINQISGK